MPEWTAETRNKMYQLLAAGRLEDAVALVATYKALKLNDLRPVDQCSLNQFLRHLLRSECAQEILWRTLVSNEQSVRRFGLLVLKPLSYIPGKVLPKIWNEINEGLRKIMIEREQSMLVEFYELAKGCDRFRGMNRKEVLASIINSLPSCLLNADLVPLKNLLKGVCARPTEEGLEIYREAYNTFAQIRADTNLAIMMNKARTKLKDKKKADTEHEVPVDDRAKSVAEQFLRSSALGGRRLHSRWSPQQNRDELIALMSSADLPGIARLVNQFPKLAGEKIRTMCEGLPWEALNALESNTHAVIQLFAWMEQAGSLAEVAFEWVKQANWGHIRLCLLRWIRETAESTKTWQVRTGKGIVLKSSTKSPKLKRHMKLLAERLDADLVCLLSSAFHNSRQYSVWEYMQQEIVSQLLRQRGPAIAREILGGVARSPAELKGSAVSDYERYVWHMVRILERKYVTSDPILEITFLESVPPQSLEDIETKYIEWKSNGGYWPSGFSSFLTVDRFAEETVAHLVSFMQSDDAFHVDRAFRLLLLRPDVVSRLGYNLAELTALCLWRVKKDEAKKAILRLQALVERKICAPKEAAGYIEQVFTSDEPSLWRAAADAIKSLRKQDPAIQISSADRIRELIARDPAKHEKYLKPLLT